MLFHCPVFNSFRSDAEAKIPRYFPPAPWDMKTMLGCYADTNSLKSKGEDYIAYAGKILDITGEYLLAINKYMHRL